MRPTGAGAAASLIAKDGSEEKPSRNTISDIVAAMARTAAQASGRDFPPLFRSCGSLY
jgi:hypothetical protein